MEQILKGVGYIHGSGHKILDLTPSDIFFWRLPDHYIVKIMCLGEANHEAFRRVTLHPDGTNGYHAPEVEWEKDYGETTFSADVFSLGMIFWEILTSCQPSQKKIKDTETNHLIKPIDLAADHIKDAHTQEWIHANQDAFDQIIRKELKMPQNLFEDFLLNMLRFDPKKRIPQVIDKDILKSLSAILK
jgi:serine/threonine protein kinase